MIESAPPAAPAQPVVDAPIPTQSAERDLASKGDFKAFDKAHLAAKSGSPLPDVPVTPDAPVAAAPLAQSVPSPVSKRQQATNDAIRESVERATAEANAEIARLRTQIDARSAPTQSQTPAPDAPPAVPEYKRFSAMPDAPKLEQFDSLDDFGAAMALFIADKRHEERQGADQRRQSDAQRDDYLKERDTHFRERLGAAAAADPDFINKIPPALLTAKPLSALTPAERARATFANVAAEVAFHSDNPEILLPYLHAHQDETLKVAALPPAFWQAALARLDGRLSAAAAPAASLESAITPEPPAPALLAQPSTISAAPPPPPAFKKTGTASDPKASALARNDFVTFDKLEMQEKLAQRARA